jgi:hypothetical protein
MSGARSAFGATAKTLPWALRGGVAIVSGLAAIVTWVSVRAVPPAYHFGSEVIRRPLDWAFHVVLTSLGFWRQVALDSPAARWLMLGLVPLCWLGWHSGSASLVLSGIAVTLALGAVLGLSLEYRAHKVRQEEEALNGTE